ncbi:MAG TPA: hypothetical protein VED01_25890 [Burkholderiales bacterium]|nr:hypothetical protein [Burkholderiales bacterium]
MNCTLLIPGLFWARETADAVLSGIELPALTELLSRARRQPVTHGTLAAWLCASHGIARQRDWPIAPLTLAHDGVDPGDAYWLRADPVHIRVERDGLTFVATALLALSDEESQALAASLKAHFEAIGIAFHAPSARRWYVNAAGTPDLVTHAPDEVAGRDVQASLPHGDDALQWHGVFNEAQMLLHAHPVNAGREDCGAPTVNSIWFWGGGTRPRVATRPFTHVWSDNAEATAVAAASGARTAALPGEAQTLLQQAHDATPEHLVVLDQLAAPAAYRDADVWRDRLAQLEPAWFSPLAAALRSGTLKRLTLIALATDGGVRFDVTRGDLLKFWRGRKPLSQLA